MSQYVDVGFSNYLEVDKIIGISKPDSMPIRKLIQRAREEGRFIDYTQGKKKRSIIISECGDSFVVTASSLLTSTIVSRIKRATQPDAFIENLATEIHYQDNVVNEENTEE